MSAVFQAGALRISVHTASILLSGLLIRQVNPYADDYTLFVQPSAARALESLSAAFGAGPMLKCCMRINTGYLEICCKYVDVTEDVSFSFKKRLSAPRDIKIWLSFAAIFFIYFSCWGWNQCSSHAVHFNSVLEEGCAHLVDSSLMLLQTLIPSFEI